MFEKALREKYRFDSSKGLLTTEQLFDVPLTSTTGFSLDQIAIDLDQKIKASAQQSFVKSDTAKDAMADSLKDRLAIVVHIIEYKQAAAKSLADSREKAEQRRKLLDILEVKRAQSLQDLSIEDIEKQLRDLG